MLNVNGYLSLWLSPAEPESNDGRLPFVPLGQAVAEDPVVQAVTVWGTVPVFVHTTFVPLVTVWFAGLKPQTPVAEQLEPLSKMLIGVPEEGDGVIRR